MLLGILFCEERSIYNNTSPSEKMKLLIYISPHNEEHAIGLVTNGVLSSGASEPRLVRSAPA